METRGNAAENLPGLTRWEEGMNPEQLRGVRHGRGPCALLAVAGCGKTRVLVNRIAKLIDDGVDASAICAVTFSQKAALEMNDRLDKLGIDGARVGTWHSLCLQILKEDRTRWSTWEVDKNDRHLKGVLKEVLGYKHLNWRDADLGDVCRYVGHCKANLADPGSDEARAIAEDEFAPHLAQKAADAFVLFQKFIEERGILRFDDFLVFAHRHLTIEENRLKWAARWDYLLVDESQDDALTQVAIRELLARDHRNLMVIGDPAQSIYGFRGSSPQYLVDFAGQWGAETIVANRNYRSGRRIVEVANKIIAPAEIKLPDEMIAERGTEGSVEARRHSDLDDEGAHFADWVKKLVAGGEKLSSVCALFRTNAQSRALEEALLNEKIPYVVVGGTSFYERKEVKDLLAYLRVAAGRDDDEGDGVKRSINAPFRYLGHAFVERLNELSGEWVGRVDQASKQAGIQDRQRRSALEWVGVVNAAKNAIEREKPAKPSEVLNDVIHKTGYVAWLEQDQGEESVENSHAANVRELARIAERFATVGELLDYVDEMISASKRKTRGPQDRVLLMSIHKSKGLEWPNVWVSGCNEKVLPHAKGDPEEERRLMYVACTRAMDRLVLSYVSKFAVREGVREATPSRFLRDAGFLAEPPANEDAMARVAKEMGREVAATPPGSDLRRAWLGSNSRCPDCGDLLTAHDDAKCSRGAGVAT